jgi:hypothetical protein
MVDIIVQVAQCANSVKEQLVAVLAADGHHPVIQVAVVLDGHVRLAELGAD